MKHLLTCSVVALAVLVGSAPARADTQPTTATDKAAVDPMKAMEAAATPGEPHKALQKSVGTWETKVRMWMAPDAKPEESTGKSEIRSVMDGRFIHESMQGQMMGKPFMGAGLTGYDNTKKKYVSTWTDNMSTGITMTEGTSKNSGKTIESEGSYTCPITGKDMSFRSIMRQVDKNKMVYEHFMKDDKGKEYKSLEVTYMRSK